MMERIKKYVALALLLPYVFAMSGCKRNVAGLARTMRFRPKSERKFPSYDQAEKITGGNKAFMNIGKMNHD